MIIIYYPKHKDILFKIKIDKKSEIILETEGNHLPTKESVENFIRNEDKII